MLHEVNSFPKRVEISLSPGPNHKHVFLTKALMRRCNPYNYNLEWSRRGEAAPLGVGWRWRRDPDEVGVPANGNETISGWSGKVESTRGGGNCFLRQILVQACPRSVRTALQSRFGTSSGAEISFLGRNPTSPASGPLARVGPPLERYERYELTTVAGTPRLAVAKKPYSTYKPIVPNHTNIVPDRSSTPSTNSRGLITHPTLGERDSPQISHGPVLSLLPFGFIIIYNVGARPPEAKVTQSRMSGVMFGRSS